MAFDVLAPMGIVLAGAGVKYVLTDGSVPVPGLAAQANAAMPGPQPSGTQARPSYQRQAPQSYARPAAQPATQPSQGMPRQSLGSQTAPQENAAPVASPSAWQRRNIDRQAQASPLRTTAAPTVVSVPFTRLSQAEFPPDWQALLARSKPGRIAWTYWELGQDLSGNADPTRRSGLAALIKHLRRPAGTHTFWPVAMPQGATLCANRDAFWSGLELLQARILVVMGYRAAKGIGLEGELKPLMDMRRNGYLVWVTWDFQHIIEQPDRYRSIVTFLDAKLRQMRL